MHGWSARLNLESGKFSKSSLQNDVANMRFEQGLVPKPYSLDANFNSETGLIEFIPV